jgi:hypothetical protein
MYFSCFANLCTASDAPGSAVIAIANMMQMAVQPTTFVMRILSATPIQARREANWTAESPLISQHVGQPREMEQGSLTSPLFRLPRTP